MSLFGVLVFVFCVRAFWCDLHKSYFHGCPACWATRYLLTVGIAAVFS